MAFLLARGSALEWLRRQIGPTPVGRRYVLRPLELESSYLRFRKYHGSLAATLRSPVHLGVAMREDRRRAKGIRSHLLTAPDGEYPVFRVERAVFCSAPEFLLLQMGTVLDADELTFLGYELCGRYGFDQLGNTADRAPICSVETISELANRAFGVHGRKRVRAIIPDLIDGAASPMEAALVICLTFAVEKGGCGLPKPLLNHSLPVEGEARRIWGGDTITPDILWLLDPVLNGGLKGIVIEYDSDLHHTGPQRIARDSRRRNVLEAMGYRVITVTNEQFADTRELEGIAMLVAGQLGAPFEEAVDEEWLRRVALHKKIRGLGMHPERLLRA